MRRRTWRSAPFQGKTINKRAWSDWCYSFQNVNLRSLDPISAKLFFYYSRCYELADNLAEIRSYTPSRPSLLTHYLRTLLPHLRTATLRHNYEGQVTLLNLLLRNFLHYNLYDQAEKLASKTEFQAQHATSNEAARYHYYLGRIYAVQLKYRYPCSLWLPLPLLLITVNRFPI